MHPLRLLRVALPSIAALIALYWLLLFLFQRSLLFPRAFVGSALARPTDAQQVWLETPDGRIEAWFLPPLTPTAAPAPLILYAHGNGELIDFWPEAFAPARHAGLAVLLVEYPGYGRSTGSPSETSITHTMLAAYDWAKSNPRVNPERIVGYGRSLGGGAVCRLLGERAFAALILESTFTSVRTFAHRFAAPGWLVRDPFDSLAALARYHGPVLVLHGDRDEVIPLEQGRALADATHAEFRLMHGGHNDCVQPWSEILDFLKRKDVL
jgi:fermentation-respiration switch protein FrsA (DUF1100 family)